MFAIHLNNLDLCPTQQGDIRLSCYRKLNDYGINESFYQNEHTLNLENRGH